MIQELADEAEAADWQEHVQAVLTKPTVAKLVALTSFPKRMEEVAEGLGGYNPGRVGANLKDAASIASALNAGNPKLAAQLLARRRGGFKNSEKSSVDSDGNPTQSDRWGNTTEITDMLLGHVRSRDPTRLEQAKGIAGMVIALSVDPEDVPQVLAKAGFKDDRTAAEKKAAARRINLDMDEEA